jgi:hypothetical protein
MPENGNAYPNKQTSMQNAPAASRDGVIPPTCQRLADGSIVLPRFAILDECEFFDKDHSQTVKMTPERLGKIAQRINDRISRTGDAPPVIPGHTVAGLPEEKQPRIIGKVVHAAVEDFINPITKQPVYDEKLGRIKKALYVTPIAEPGEFETFRKLRRGRSVELWIDPEGDDIDPVALLGSNTPRRDLGPHQFNLAQTPRGLHKFRRYGSSQSIHFEIETEDEGDDMATEPPVGDQPGADSQRQETEFENSALGKRLDALANSMEAYMPMLQQMFEMYEGGQGQGDPGASQPGQMQPGQSPMPAGGAQAPTGQDDDLFAAPADAGHQGQPTPMGSAGCASPGGSTNMNMPGHDRPRNMGSMGVPAAEPRHMPASHMSRDTGTQLKLARTENMLQLAMQKIHELEQVNLAGEVERELRAIEPEFEFDYAEEFATMMKFSKAEERAGHIQRIVKHFRRRADAPPGGGQFAVAPGAIQLSRSGGMLTPQQAQTEFGRQQLMAQQAAQQQPPRGPAASMSDAEIVQAAAAIHARRAGQPLQMQPGMDGMTDVMGMLNQWAAARQQPNGVAANGTAVR